VALTDSFSDGRGGQGIFFGSFLWTSKEMNRDSLSFLHRPKDSSKSSFPWSGEGGTDLQVCDGRGGQCFFFFASPKKETKKPGLIFYVKMILNLKM